MNWTEEQLKNALKNKNISIEQDLFGEVKVGKKEGGKTKNLPFVLEAIEKGYGFWLPGNTPGKKNNLDIVEINTGKTKCCGASYTKIKSYHYKCNECGKEPVPLRKFSRLANSTEVEAYKNNIVGHIIQFKRQWNKIASGKTNYILGMYFVRKSLRTWDFDNAMTTIADVLKEHHFIPDDDAYQYEHHPLGFHIDKEPGVYIILIKEPKFEI